MVRVGIVGSDNSHALAFAKLANVEKNEGEPLFKNVRVTAIWGQDEKRTAEVAAQGQIEEIVNDPKELLSKVDAVMVVLRDGALHYQHAMPFVQAGMPTWVDKPFTIQRAQAEELVLAAKQSGSLLAGGSTCKYCPDVLRLKEEFEKLSDKNGVISAAFNFPGEINSPYGGIYFYGGHSAEILITIFGTGLQSIKADVHCGNIVAIFKYGTFSVVVNFAEVSEFYGQIYSSGKVVNLPIDISSVYKEGFAKFSQMLQSKKMPESFESLLRPVIILNALEKAIETGKEVSVSLVPTE